MTYRLKLWNIVKLSDMPPAESDILVSISEASRHSGDKCLETMSNKMLEGGIRNCVVEIIATPGVLAVWFFVVDLGRLVEKTSDSSMGKNVRTARYDGEIFEFSEFKDLLSFPVSCANYDPNVKIDPHTKMISIDGAIKLLNRSAHDSEKLDKCMVYLKTVIAKSGSFIVNEHRIINTLIDSMGKTAFTTFSGIDVCYIMFVAFVNEMFLFKFGHTMRMPSRIKEHCKTFNCDAKVVAVCKTMTAASAETKFAAFLRSKGLIHTHMGSDETFHTTEEHDIRSVISELNRICNSVLTASEAEVIIANLQSRIEDKDAVNREQAKRIIELEVLLRSSNPGIQ